MGVGTHNWMAGHSTAFHARSYKIFKTAIYDQNMKGGIFFFCVQIHDYNLFTPHANIASHEIMIQDQNLTSNTIQLQEYTQLYFSYDMSKQQQTFRRRQNQLKLKNYTSIIELFITSSKIIQLKSYFTVLRLTSTTLSSPQKEFFQV